MTTRVLLIDPDDARRKILLKRLTAQGHAVEDVADAVKGAEMALAAPRA